jgi:hypothetical protein
MPGPTFSNEKTHLEHASFSVWKCTVFETKIVPVILENDPVSAPIPA